MVGKNLGSRWRQRPTEVSLISGTVIPSECLLIAEEMAERLSCASDDFARQRDTDWCPGPAKKVGFSRPRFRFWFQKAPTHKSELEEQKTLKDCRSASDHLKNWKWRWSRFLVAADIWEKKMKIYSLWKDINLGLKLFLETIFQNSYLDTVQNNHTHMRYNRINENKQKQHIISNRTTTESLIQSLK